MWIENIDLDDFGCFERARLQTLGNGLTVISGPQRAGKSTFMDAVRCLGYGISGSDTVPPPSEKYAVTADLVTDEGRYELSIDGFANPTIACRGDAPERTVEELYGGLGKTQYQQLYTISLDELRRVPNSLGEDAELSAILLGAAYGDILAVPTVLDRLSGEAKSIGGKHGRGVYGMGDPMDRIEEGIEERDRALEQVEQYERTADERNRTEARITEIDGETERLVSERIRLEAVLTNHDEYERFTKLEQQVADHGSESLDSFPIDRLDRAERLEEVFDEASNLLREQIEEFTAIVPAETPGAYRGRLLSERDEIEQYAREKAGWRQRLTAIDGELEDLRSRKRELKHRVESLHPDWERDLSHVRGLEVDLLARDFVRTTVETYRDVEREVTDLERTIAELDARENDLERRIDDAVESADTTGLREQIPAVVVGTLVAILGGFLAGIAVGPVLGVIVTSVFFVATGAFVGSQLESGTPSHDGVAVDTLRSEREKVASERTSRETTLEDRSERLEALGRELEDLRETYGLPADVSATAILEFHRELVELREAVTTYDEDLDDLERCRDELYDDLCAVADTLEAIDVLPDEWDDPVEDASTIFAAIDRASEHLVSAEEVATAEQRVARVEREIDEHISAWDGTGNFSDVYCDGSDAGVDDSDADGEDSDADGEDSDADGEDSDTTSEVIRNELRTFLESGKEIEALLEAKDEAERSRERLRTALRKASVEPSLEVYREQDDVEEWHLNAYERILDEYGDVETIADRLEAIEAELEERDGERTNLVERRVDLTRELEELRSDDDVREAHATIERGRKRLEPLAEEYASLRIAEYLLEELHERFVERTTGPLLEEAATIFERITGSTYVSLDSTDEFENLDFEATLGDGRTHRSGELSRATAEQLFLSVRLAKIKLHDVALPVLLDDSLTNFDPVHVDRTLKVVDELAAENQVFLLTCHPTLLEHVDRNARVEGYWSVDAGEFAGPYESPKTPISSLQSTLRNAADVGEWIDEKTG